MKCKRGIESLNAVILATTILVITLVSARVATHLLKLEIYKAEFEEAKETMLILADIIEEVGTKMLSSGYVKFNRKVGRVDFLKNSSHVKLQLQTINESKIILDVYTSSIRYKSGAAFAFAGDRHLRGDKDSIIINEAASLITVKEYLNETPIVQLYGRSIRLVKIGSVYLENLYNGTGGYVNVYEITFIKINIGLTFGIGDLNVKAYGKNVTINTYFINSTDFQLKLIINGEEVDSVLINGPENFNSAPVQGSLIYVVITEVELATI